MRRELLAGLSTFFTVSYLLLLYPNILSAGGLDFGAALTATILTIVCSTLFLALYADFPAILVPGLSVGPFLVYSVILQQGASWQTALGIVFWAGIAIFLLTLFKVRQKILLYLPLSIKTAAIAGIGLFLICVALKDLGFPHQHVFNVPIAIALSGLILFFILHYFQIRSAFLLAILASWLAAFLFGLAPFHGIVALPSSLSPTWFKLNFLLNFEWFGTLLTVVLIALFDTSASLTVLSKLAHKLDDKGHIKQIDKILIPDGLGSVLAGLLGTGTLCFALESSAGIKAGGRHKWTAIIAALSCLIGLFFHPLIASIPSFATTPAILAIGIFMTMEIKHIKWKSITESIPAFIMIFTIPIAFSIYRGFAFGFVSYALLKGLRGEWKDVHPVCWSLAIIFAAHLSWALITHHM
ncbi:MAG: NCS2 family permease [Verrucomicrobia bacterium]|nr:NCS2 family permease [Verrucomicrobiota bacterium]MDE3047900.1 NCS2 family permease [Verrucomicrobiota bacterium]